MNEKQRKFTLQVFAGIAVFVTFLQLMYQSALSASELGLYGGLFVGVALKVVAPFIRKIQEAKVETFSVKYFWTGVISFFYLLPISYSIIQYINIGNLPWSLAFILGVFIGLGGNWTTEEVTRYFLYLKELYKAYGEIYGNGQEKSTESSENTSGESTYNLPLPMPQPAPAVVPVIVDSKNEEDKEEESQEE